MAEAVLRNALRGQEEITVESAGLGALVDWPASEHAEALMRERGIDISSHKARQLTAEMIHDADLILVMETGHKKAIEAENATARGKVFRLGEWRDTEIDDPFRKPKAAFVDALAEIDASITGWVERLNT
jgi:protein-tyrosine phosphatase